jgi:hypothetical protein
MIITKQQAQLLADLSGQIQDKYGIIIGYSNPALRPSPTMDADFIIFESPDVKELVCYYKDDIKTQPLGPYMVRVLPNNPEHDEKVEGLLSRINGDILDGKIWFDPGVEREVDGLKISVTKKVFPGTSQDVFDINVFTERYGTVYTYEFITEAALKDKRFRIAKDIIDDVWPRPKKGKAASEQNTDSVSDLLARIFRLFGI